MDIFTVTPECSSTPYPGGDSTVNLKIQEVDLQTLNQVYLAVLCKEVKYSSVFIWNVVSFGFLKQAKHVKVKSKIPNHFLLVSINITN